MNKVSWRSPSNIALIKYWGKKENQIPLNPSISFTLDASFTETKVEYKTGLNARGISIDFLFEGKAHPFFEERISKYINSIIQFIPSLNGMYLKIESKNSFPHSAGIASSASAMSALALCLVTIEKNEKGSLYYIDDFYKKASFIARLGSGSAARSVFGGVNLWGYTPDYKHSSNEYAINLSNNIHEVFKNYHNAVLIISKTTKKVSSSLGHSLMNNNPFTDVKIKNAFSNAKKFIEILKSGDLNDFSLVVENEALTLHAMMLTSLPGFILMEPNTIEIINRIQHFRLTTNIPVCFTLDAGANVHLLYPEAFKKTVVDFISSNLTAFCQNNLWLDDKVGQGPNEVIIK